MKLLTKAQELKLIDNFKKQDGTKEFNPVVKLFHPTGGTWYISELDPNTNDAFGLAIIYEAEFGYTNLDELKNVNHLGLKVERDMYWTPVTYEQIQKEVQ